MKLSDYFDIHEYISSGLEISVFAPGGWDGSYLNAPKHYQDIIMSCTNAYVAANPGKQPIFAVTEWGDDANKPGEMATYKGSIYMAHTLYRHIENKFVISCPWYMWNNRDTAYDMFGGPPLYKERPRYFVYLIYKNFGNEMCTFISFVFFIL